ncbi:MAG: hypothetical protein H0W25_04345 [Acidimicrobiia bacterium]|nr:hypothetical protein [Acidimicrobiia bacterium]
MAVRIELFAVAGTADFELVSAAALDAAVAAFDASDSNGEPAAGVRCLGWLSASDDDEAAFGGWCEHVDEHLGAGLLPHGLGEGEGLDPAAVPASAAEPEASWASTLRAALEDAVGGRVGWRTRFDAAGTTGTDDDFPTATARAPEG